MQKHRSRNDQKEKQGMKTEEENKKTQTAKGVFSAPNHYSM